MSKHKDLETVIFQIRIKRVTECDSSLTREVVYIELSGETQKEDSVKSSKKKKKLWKTPLVEENLASSRQYVTYTSPLIYEDIKPDPVELTFKLKHGSDKSHKTLAVWKLNVMRFYKVTEHVNTVVFKTEDGPRITVNVMDITELQKKGGIPPTGGDEIPRPSLKMDGAVENAVARAQNQNVGVVDATPESTDLKSPKPTKRVMEGFGSDGNGNMTGSARKRQNSVKKLKKRFSAATLKKKKEKGEPIEESEERISEVEISTSDVSAFSEASEVSVSEAKYAKEDASEAELPSVDLSNFDFSPKKLVPELSSNLFSLDSIVKDDRKFDSMYKVIIIGNSGVGKSSVMGRWTRDEFALNMPSTIHVELSAKTFDCKDKIVKVQFWDTAGQERFNSITRQYYRGAQGAVLVYDITQRNTFEAIPRWLKDLRDANQDAQILLVGNKSDLDQYREVPLDEGVEYSKRENISFLETSAMSGDNCTLAMQLILQDIHKTSNAKASLQSSASTGKVPSTSVKLAYEEPKQDEGEQEEGTKATTEDKKKDKCEC